MLLIHVLSRSRRTQPGCGRFRLACLLLLLAALVQTAAAAPDDAPLPLGYGALGYAPPEPGTYALPRLFSAADGDVLNSDGNRTRLHEVFGERIVLLSFIYSTCGDVAGCPLATAVFHRIKQRLQKEPALAERIRMVTLSFDPLQDTPEVMRVYGEGLKSAAVDWHFLTTASPAALEPILDAYDQSVQMEYDEKGQALGTYSHILRVFLIDSDTRVRNIYSISFLHPDLLISDVKSLLLEATPSPLRKTGMPDKRPLLSGAGDYKDGYAREDYRTRSRSLQNREGASADLLALVRSPPLGLPSVPIPADNPITADKVALGRKLFYDRRLSLNNTFSCAMCHIPEQGFTSNEMATAVGFEGRTVRRNAPTIYNAAYLTRLFHNGREYSLEQQIWGPLLASNEMANPSVGSVIDKLRRLQDYRGRFEATFDGRAATMETLGAALASYQRTLISANSAFDRWYYGGNEEALSPEAHRGFALFTGKARCSACHSIGEGAALFTDNAMHNTGIGYRESMHREPPSRAVVVAPGVTLDVPAGVIDSVSEQPANDLGLYEVTQNPDDRWKYRTPSLRNVALTAPYMHNGSLGNLKAVVEFYNQGGVPNETLDPMIRPLGLTSHEATDLEAFLYALTGDNTDMLVGDAFAAPVGDPTTALRQAASE